jgi:hypothetical protein
MADLNAWVAKRQAAKLRELRGDVLALQALCKTASPEDRAQRRMASRVVQLVDEHIARLDGEAQDAEGTSFSSDEIDEGLRA